MLAAIHMPMVSTMPGAISTKVLRPTGQKLVRENERHQKHHARDGEPAECDETVERLEIRREMQQHGPEQRGENDQESEGQKREGADENIGDGFKAEQPPRPHLHDAIGTVETNSDGFDAARRKIDRQNHTNRQKSAARVRQRRCGFHLRLAQPPAAAKSARPDSRPRLPNFSCRKSRRAP